MPIRASKVRIDEAALAHPAVLRVGDEPYRGLKPLAGVTGSGKTLLAEALRLGAACTLSAQLGERRSRSTLATAATACGIRPIDAEFAVCLPELGRKAGVEVGVSEGVEGWTAAPAPEADCAEGRKRLKQAAA